MVAAIATGAAGLDPNTERVKWLKDTSREFKDLREQLTTALRLHEGCKDL